MERMDFHIHSDYSDDGAASLEDIITEALRWGFVAIGVVDHVRGDADWLPDRKSRLSDLRETYRGDIEIFSGIEVKVTDGPEILDLAERAREDVDFVVASFHGAPESGAGSGEGALVAWWCDSMSALMEGKGKANVIGHPDRILTARNMAVRPEKLEELTREALSTRLFLEWNPATSYPSQPLAQRLADKDAANLIYASDAHSVEEQADAYRGITSFEAGMVERGNASFLETLRRGRNERG